MSASGSTSLFAANSNPFASPDERRTPQSAIQPVIEEEESDPIASPTSPSFNLNATAAFRGPFGGWDGTNDGPPSANRLTAPEGYPEQFNTGRRSSVSAESLKPSDNNWNPPFYQKTPEQLEWLKEWMKKAATEGSLKIRFQELDEEQSAQVLGAFHEKLIPAKGIKVITQGDVGEYFYACQKGSFDIYKHPSGALQPGPDGLGEYIGKAGPGDSFGDLALLHNILRQATVMSAEANCVLWELDRVTFTRVVIEKSSARNRMFDEFLSGVPDLATLTPAERNKLSVALKPRAYPAGATIIREGDEAKDENEADDRHKEMYFLQDGEAEAYKAGIAEPVKRYKKGDFFGELALLNNEPRAASVVCKTDVTVAVLDKDSLQRLLGPLKEILRRTTYEDIKAIKTGVEDIDPLQSA